MKYVINVSAVLNSSWNGSEVMLFAMKYAEKLYKRLDHSLQGYACPFSVLTLKIFGSNGPGYLYPKTVHHRMLGERKKR